LSPLLPRGGKGRGKGEKREGSGVKIVISRWAVVPKRDCLQREGEKVKPRGGSYDLMHIEVVPLPRDITAS